MTAHFYPTDVFGLVGIVITSMFLVIIGWCYYLTTRQDHGYSFSDRELYFMMLIFGAAAGMGAIYSIWNFGWVS